MDDFIKDIQKLSHVNKYTYWYCAIIQQAATRSQHVQGENHHIVPRSIDPDNISTKENIVKLTYREHYIVHLLLPKMLKSTKFKMKMINAILSLCVGLKRNTNHSNNLYASRKYSTIRTMIYNSGIFSNCKDTVWVNNAKLSKRISKQDLDKFIQSGWEIGRKTFTRKTSIDVNKNGVTKRVNPKNKNRYILDGWSLGRSPRDTICVTDGIHNIYVLPDSIPTGYTTGSCQRTQLGKRWITNGEDDVYIYPGDDIPVGWKLGRSNAKLKKCYNTNTGKIKINNGTDQRFILSTDHIPEGWVRGGLSQTKKWKWTKTT